MKKIEAIIRPEKLDAVRSALEKAGCLGLMITEIEGHGKQKGVVRGYKIGVTKWLRKHTDIYCVWQRNYYEHIIRNDPELTKIREYILANPAMWDSDEENPANLSPVRLVKTFNRFAKLMEPPPVPKKPPIGFHPHI